tara:strand:+ start:881 stop:1399 length:519 start_codon:yes stop_codon:yes gene_type:complete
VSYLVDEVTFVLKLLEDNWTNDALNAGLDQHKPVASAINFIDVRSLEPQKGRRVDADEKAIIIVYEDSASISHPTIDWSVRNEEYSFTIHLRVLHQKDWGDLNFSRQRLQSLYQIVRHIIERNGLRPKVTVGSNTYTAELIDITGRSEANDRNKRLLGYKMSVTMKRFGRTT